MDRGAWWAAVHRVTESEVTEATKQRQHIYLLILFQIIFPYMTEYYVEFPMLYNSHPVLVCLFYI